MLISNVNDVKIKMIVAMTENNVIGNKGDIPWMLKEEMSHFKKTTTNPTSTVIMGYSTYESLLPYNKLGYLEGRINLVLTNSQEKADYSQLRFGFENPSLSFLTSYELNKSSLQNIGALYDTHIYIIGGAKVYKWALDNDLVDEIILSRIKYKLKGDTKLEIKNLDRDFTLLSIEERKDFDIMFYQRSEI